MSVFFHLKKKMWRISYMSFTTSLQQRNCVFQVLSENKKLRTKSCTTLVDRSLAHLSHLKSRQVLGKMLKNFGCRTWVDFES